ncbi:endonuclease/exonuclease/phosphatase family protein [Alteromonas stellipolaris]|uniref:endonuclease/exonuclease/phosphatase family protein n=1 Tax=Alteromonas stellipolaris TaxID=233316 RepID=UPI001D8AF0AD|nr:endonuclease/exonuclease/phosphatase family protein [Alteromonas stellipolaris]MBZ2161896.1 endonuclease/exonuclease/phosphatase family protein [Alteromonas stellipolaris]
MILALCRAVSILLLCIVFVVSGAFIFNIELFDIFYFIDFLPDYVLFLLCVPALIFLGKSKQFLVPLALVAIFFASPFNLSLFNSEVGAATNHENQLSIASYNVAQRVEKERLYNWFVEQDLDILFIQEASRLGQFNVGEYEGIYTNCVQRLCILSRFALEELDSLDRKPLGGWGRFVSLHKVEIEGESVLLANVHFASISNFGYRFTTLKGFESKVSLFKEAKAVEFGLAKALVNKWSTNDAVIIAGDFNITDRNAQYEHYWGELDNLFAVSGNGYGSTRKSRLVSPRIDHLLVTKAFTPIYSEIGDDLGSDHLPILGTIVLEGTESE